LFLNKVVWSAYLIVIPWLNNVVLLLGCLLVSVRCRGVFRNTWGVLRSALNVLRITGNIWRVVWVILRGCLDLLRGALDVLRISHSCFFLNNSNCRSIFLLLWRSLLWDLSRSKFWFIARFPDYWVIWKHPDLNLWNLKPKPKQKKEFSNESLLDL